MPHRLRTFIAVPVDRFTHDRLVGLQKRLADAGVPAKWVEPENLHVTLLFLGEVDARDVPPVCRLVAECTAQQPPFLMSIERPGCFPTPRRPRLLWAGVGEGTQPLVALHDALEGQRLD